MRYTEKNDMEDLSVNDPVLLPLLLQLILILLNAFFACTEIAVLTLSQTAIRQAADSGSRRARYLLKLTARPAHFLATIQVGITLAGFLASAFAAESFSDRLVAWLIGLGAGLPADTLNTIVVIVITLILSYFMLVLGELLPKRIAMKKAQKIAHAFSGPIYFLSKLFAPIVWLLTASVNGLLRLLRIDPHADDASVTEEEIRILVDLGEEKGAIEPDEGRMIDNVLELADKTAATIMTPRTDLDVLWQRDSREVWRQTICTSNYSRYPVCGGDLDDVRGVLHVRDLLCDGGSGDIVRPAYFVPETAGADALMHDMQRRHEHMAVVVDEYGGTSGVVTLEDILEEIVGEIEDEHDEEEPLITMTEPGRWRVHGGIDLAALGKAVGVRFPEGDYETLGGLVFAQMDSIPPDGTHPELDVDGVHIRVDELAGRRIEWATVSVRTEDGES